MTRDEMESIVAWLQENAAKISYGQITVSVTLHDGQARLIEKTISEKTQLAAPGANHA